MDLGNKRIAIRISKGLIISSCALLSACGGDSNNAASSDTTSATSSNTMAAAPVAAAALPTPAPVAVVVAPPPPPSRYLKLDGGGNEMPANASNWSCVKDKETGLVWEAKTDDNGLRDKDWRFRHFHNFAGYASSVDYNGNILCQNLGSASCDAYSYVNALKATGLCGRNDWRLPIQEELLNLVKYHADGSPPNIDRTYFSDTVKGAYCAENIITNPTDCGYAAGSAVSYNGDGRIECNYQGVDFGAVVRADNPRGDSMVALRFSGEVQDGKTAYPNANWICYTRLVSGQR
jgi:hypothetical protein